MIHKRPSIVGSVSGICLFLAMCTILLPPSMVAGEMPESVRSARNLASILVQAYPDAGIALIEDWDGLYIGLDGKKLLLSPWEGCPAATPDQEDDAPLCAMFTQPYPVGSGGRYPAQGFDPGRVRNQALLQLLYGENPQAVVRSSAPVAFLGETLPFNVRQGANKALARVAVRLAELSQRQPDLQSWILPTSGTYAWRTIKNSKRLSSHSFATSIDLNTQKGLYWLWHPDSKVVEATRKNYPQSIVDAFEAEGFIWGGKWHAFDFMHFEYRPELILHGKQQDILRRSAVQHDLLAILPARTGALHSRSE